MRYEIFKESILEGLKQHYGNEVVMEVKPVVKNYNRWYDGLHILLKKEEQITPIIYLNELYERYCRKEMDLSQCIRWILDVRNQKERTEFIYEFAKHLTNWEAIKEQVYPGLVSYKENESYVNQFVSTLFLDLAVVYRINCLSEDGTSYSVKIKGAMLESYGITVEQLHQQAVQNLEKEGYRFTSLEQMMRELLQLPEAEDFEGSIPVCPDLFILTNEAKLFGTSVLLDSRLLKKIVGDRNYYVMMPCMHEAVFLLDDGEMEKEKLEEAVRGLLQEAIEKEDQLSSCYYYYDGTTGEVRMG